MEVEDEFEREVENFKSNYIFKQEPIKRLS